MGQTSSQPGSPRLSQEPDSETTRSRKKKKKSKSRKPRNDDGDADNLTERAALEEESARALMQLSSSASHSGAPYYVQEGDLQPSTDNVEQPHREPLNGKKSLKRKRNGAKRKVQEAAEKGQLSKGSLLDGGRLQEFPVSQSTHPLDQEASDDDLVQEYERGLSEGQQIQMPDVAGPPVINADHQAGDEVTGSARQQAFTLRPSADERTRTKAKLPSNRPKRNTVQNKVQGSIDHGLPLDPTLQTISPLLPSIEDESRDLSGIHHLQGRQLGNPRKRRRLEEAQQNTENGEGPGISHHSSNTQHHHQDQAGLGHEDQTNLMYQGIDGPDTEHDGVIGLEPQAQTTKKPNKKPSEAGSKSKQGFTADEITKLDDFRDDYCKANDMPTSAFNHFIQSNLRANEQVGIIFNAIQALFPSRSRPSVQRFCRRRFHNFHARGVWTAEEDANLKAIVASRGSCWKVIGEQLGRFSEDCRDRYRNYLAPSAANRNRDAWTETEVVNLSHSILECMQRMKNDRDGQNGQNAGHDYPVSDDDSDQEAEDLKLINWQTVSDLMDSYGTARSRIQCSFKWSKIKEADRGRYLKEVKEAKRNLRNLESGNYTANNMKRSTGWRLKAASKEVQNMKSGDKFDLLNAILRSGASGEENIPWRMIGDDAFRRRWSFAERKAGWLMMKEQVEQSDAMPYQQIIQKLLAELVPLGVNERFNRDKHDLAPGSSKQNQPQRLEDDNNTTITGKKQSRSKHDRTASHPGGPKSSEFVYDSDEDEGDVEQTPTTHEDDERRDDARSESPNSLFDDMEPSPTDETVLLDPLLGDSAAQPPLNPTSAEIGPELVTRIQTHLQQAA